MTITPASTVVTVSDEISTLRHGIAELKAVVQDALASSVTVATRHSVVELSALRASSLLEDFLERVFYLSMLGQHPASDVAPTLALASRDEVDLMIYSERREKYLTWLPWDSVQARADAYLKDGRPFDRLRYRRVERRAIDEMTIVRNAVAHPGAHAWNLLEQLAAGRGYKVSRPADYLLSLRAGAPEVLTLLTQIEIVGEALVASSDQVADSLLQPEPPFEAGSKAPAGEFECMRCLASMNNPSSQKLQHCRTCGTKTTCSHCGHTTRNATQWRHVVL